MNTCVYDKIYGVALENHFIRFWFRAIQIWGIPDSGKGRIVEMKYCVHCGAGIHDEAVVCVKCGCAVPQERMMTRPVQTDDTMSIVVKVFLIMGCIAQGWMIIPLAWCIPITVSVFNSIRDRRPVSTGTAVCALLFVNLIAGICLLCMENN